LPVAEDSHAHIPEAGGAEREGIVNKLSVYNPTDASPNFGHDQTGVAERREESIHDLEAGRWPVRVLLCSPLFWGCPVLNSLDCKIRAAECEKMAENAPNPASASHSKRHGAHMDKTRAGIKADPEAELSPTAARRP